jgi:hypothetical protein
MVVSFDILVCTIHIHTIDDFVNILELRTHQDGIYVQCIGTMTKIQIHVDNKHYIQISSNEIC